MEILRCLEQLNKLYPDHIIKDNASTWDIDNLLNKFLENIPEFLENEKYKNYVIDENKILEVDDDGYIKTIPTYIFLPF